jgi:hypothetical protein
LWDCFESRRSRVDVRRIYVYEQTFLQGRLGTKGFVRRLPDFVVHVGFEFFQLLLFHDAFADQK